MKKLYLLFIILFIGFNLFSQHTIGFSGGANYMKPVLLRIAAQGPFQTSEAEVPAFGMQFYFSHDYALKIVKDLHIINHLGYINKGHNYYYKLSTPQHYDIDRMRLHYLSWSITPEYRIFKNFGIFLGTNLNFHLFSDTYLRNGDEIDAENRSIYTKPRELSLNMGITLNYKRFHARLGYMPALTPYSSVIYETLLHNDFESRMYYISLGIDLHTFKK